MAIFVATGTGTMAAERIASPDGNVGITFSLRANGEPTYAIDYLGQPLLLESLLAEAPNVLTAFNQTGISTSHRDSTWEQAHGERRRVPDQFRELAVALVNSSGRKLHVAFRAYNEGAAFQLSYPDQSPPETSGRDGGSELRFPEKTYGWQKSSAGAFERTLLPPSAHVESNGLTAELADGRFAAVAKLSQSKWQVILVGRSPGELVERNYLRHNLAPPSHLGDTTWIKAGRILSGFGPTMANARAAVDYACAAGFGYISANPAAAAPDFDLPALVNYAKERKLGVILRLERIQLRHEDESVFQKLQGLGVRGIEIDSTQAEPVLELSWLTTTATLAARHRLLLVVREQQDLAGLERTFPNLFNLGSHTTSGHPIPAGRNALLPFTSGLFGPVRYTVSQSAGATRAHTLALSVIASDPLPTISWSDHTRLGRDDQAMNFFSRVPPSWDETKVLAGEIGALAVIARRAGDNWFIGAVNGPTSRTLSLPLTFLTADRAYIMHTYADAPSTSYLSYGAKKVFSSDRLIQEIQANGGICLWITPDEKKR